MYLLEDTIQPTTGNKAETDRDERKESYEKYMDSEGQNVEYI